MTTEAPASRPPARKRVGPGPVVAATLATFLVVLTLLATQLRSGKDPALGAGPAAAPATAPKRVLVKRIIKRRVIVRVIPAETSGGAPVVAGGAAAPAEAGAAQAPSASGASAAPAPVAAAAPAPAPAAAPAAPVTRSS